MNRMHHRYPITFKGSQYGSRQSAIEKVNMSNIRSVSVDKPVEIPSYVLVVKIIPCIQGFLSHPGKSVISIGNKVIRKI